MSDYKMTETGKGPCKEGQPITVMDLIKNKNHKQTNKNHKQTNKNKTKTPCYYNEKNTSGYLLFIRGMGLGLMFKYARRATDNRSKKNCIKQILMRLHTEDLR